MAIRKNVRSLTVAEKQEFVNACLALKDGGKPGNKWDELVVVHAQMSNVFTPNGSNRTQPHGGPAFFAWHRYHLSLFEKALQAVSGNKSLGVPYWDWTDDASNPFNSPIFANDFMGGNGDTSDGSYVVRTGPFRYGNWTIVNESGNPVIYWNNRFNGALKRNFGAAITGFPTLDQLNNAVWIRNYDSPTYDQNSSNSARNAIEGFANGPQLHNRIHRWIGETMRNSTAPNDPIFYLHHSMIDRCWARWQSGNGSDTYITNPNQVPYRHGLDDPMLPWGNVTPRQMLYYGNLDYSYDRLR